MARVSTQIAQTHRGLVSVRAPSRGPTNVCEDSQQHSGTLKQRTHTATHTSPAVLMTTLPGCLSTYAYGHTAVTKQMRGGEQTLRHRNPKACCMSPPRLQVLPAEPSQADFPGEGPRPHLSARHLSLHHGQCADIQSRH
jgi:hypothetical protein